MIKAKNRWPISVCSWSLRAETNELPAIIKDFGSPQVHLAIGDLIATPAVAEKLAEELTISATMIGFAQEDYTTLETIKQTGGVLPDDSWESNLMLIKSGIELTAKMNVKFMTFHAGFIDESNPEVFTKMTERIRTVADIAAANGIILLMETGQETSADLAAFMRQMDHAALGVNFDPANMILYDKGDPIDAIKQLSPWIKHIHIKDAVKASEKGEWGAEVPWGDGEVGGKAFLDALNATGFNGALAIEREGGAQRIKDIRKAIERLMQIVK
jgi:sugar phosphate isomerase/epimerase